MLLLLFIVLALVVTLAPVGGVNITNSSSHSHRSHSHKSKSHKSKSHKSQSHRSHSHSHSHSDSHSYSSGYCNATSLDYYPLPQPTYEVNSTFPLWPTNVKVSLSGNKLGNNPSGGVGIYIYYNYTYFHQKNPSVVQDCNLAPDFSNVPYVRFIESWSEFVTPDSSINKFCNRVCVIWFYMKLTCPLTQLSGTYYLKIQGVGDVPIELSVCTKEGSDYGFDCDAIPEECRETSNFMTTSTEKDGLSEVDKVGISFGVVGGCLLIALIVMTILYFQLRDRFSKSGYKNILI